MACASSSSSSTTCSWEHDAFISFRGEDTRTGFISHLYTALTGKGIRTFKDDKKLETGNTIAIELLTAIEKSRFAVVVLSSNFATSKWCLEEIAKVVDCWKQGKLIVIPVFYHVTPSDVRHQMGSFKQAFANLEIDPELMPEKVESWRQALKTTGDLSGEHVTKHRDESEVVQKIVGRIFKNLQDMVPSVVTNGLVGMESRVDKVYARLESVEQKIFFYIACFLKGRNINLVTDILESIDLHPKFGIPNLINKFFISINHDDSIWVHDLLQQMC